MGAAERANSRGLFPGRTPTILDSVVKIMPTRAELEAQRILTETGFFETSHDPLLWRLAYADGRVIYEPPDGASILTAPKRPSLLALFTSNGVPITKIYLDLHKGERPVFYRKRSAGAVHQGFGQLDATVFGKVWENGSRIDTTLYAGISGKIVNCPSWALDMTMIELQLTEMT